MPPTIKPGTIVRETLILQRDLLNGLKISELDRWVGDSYVRELLLQNMLFGRIRWPKSNGKPLSTTLNEAFTIQHWAMVIKGADSQYLPISSHSWAPMPEPFKFDEPDDSDHYTVGFFRSDSLAIPSKDSTNVHERHRLAPSSSPIPRHRALRLVRLRNRSDYFSSRLHRLPTALVTYR